MRAVGGLRELRRFAASEIGLGVLLTVTGLLTWTVLSVWGSASSAEPTFRWREAWDGPAYFYVGLPLMALAVATAAFVRPTRIWRWPLWLAGGHQLGVLLVGLGMQSGLSLILLLVMLGALLAAGFSVPAMLGAMAARAISERAYYGVASCGAARAAAELQPLSRFPPSSCQR